jgi:hypothetical protein
MRRLLFLLLPLILMSSKCKKDDVIAGSIALNIKTSYDDKPLIINKIYDYKGKKVRFTKWSFFASSIYGPIEIIPGSFTEGKENLHYNSTFYDFSDLTDSINAQKGITQTVLSSVGSKEKFNMSIGVERSKNLKKPKDFNSSNPLSDAGNYWDDWNSYIFTKLEGLMDKDGDGKFETGITIHTGGNEVYQTLTFTKNVVVNISETTTINGDLNLNKLLNGIDLTTVNSSHQTGDLPTMKLFIGNFKEALTIK